MPRMEFIPAKAEREDIPNRVCVGSGVLVQTVGDEFVLLHTGSGQYYGLDPVGSRMWSALAATGSPAAAMVDLLGSFEVGEAQLRSDLNELLHRLLAAGLLEPDV